MNGLPHAATRARSRGPFLLVLSPPVGRELVCRQLIRHSSLIHSRSSVLLHPAPLASKFLLDEIQSTLRRTALSRSFHHSSPTLREDKAAKSAAKEEPISKEDPAEGESAKEASGENSESTSDEGKAKEEGEEGTKDDKKAPPPPPPHGNKSPWQVFTETLQTEFKASKEWNESTKALAAGAQQFTESESVRKARQAYESTTGAVSSTTGKVLKTTAGAVGKGAAWTWETPVVKAARTTVNVTASVIEKGTRPIRETEAYKNVKDVIDDGSSSRYGGWVEKEERRKTREKREQGEAQKASLSGKGGEVLKEDPE